MNPITQLQLLMVKYLLGDPNLANYPVTKYKDQVVADLAAEASTVRTERVPGKRGLAIQVRKPAIRAKMPSWPGPQDQIGVKPFLVKQIQAVEQVQYFSRDLAF